MYDIRAIVVVLSLFAIYSIIGVIKINSYDGITAMEFGAQQSVYN